MINATLSGEKIHSNSEEAFSLYEKSCFGEKKENKIVYSLIESLFLVSAEKITVHFNSKPLNFEKLLSKTKKIDKKIETKFLVYSDLRKKGYIPKAALKYGADLRVYDKGIRPGQDHAKWILFAVNETHNINWQEFAAKNRIAHSTKKNLLIALIDQERDITYYQVSWFRP